MTSRRALLLFIFFLTFEHDAQLTTQTSPKRQPRLYICFQKIGSDLNTRCQAADFFSEYVLLVWALGLWCAGVEAYMGHACFQARSLAPRFDNIDASFDEAHALI